MKIVIFSKQLLDEMLHSTQIPTLGNNCAFEHNPHGNITTKSIKKIYFHPINTQQIKYLPTRTFQPVIYSDNLIYFFPLTPLPPVRFNINFITLHLSLIKQESTWCLKAFYQSKSSALITQYISVRDESKISCVHIEDLSTWCGGNLWFSDSPHTAHPTQSFVCAFRANTSNFIYIYT